LKILNPPFKAFVVFLTAQNYHFQLSSACEHTLKAVKQAVVRKGCALPVERLSFKGEKWLFIVKCRFLVSCFSLLTPFVGDGTQGASERRIKWMADKR
jgi:hypothetical protein